MTLFFFLHQSENKITLLFSLIAYALRYAIVALQVFLCATLAQGEEKLRKKIIAKFSFGP